MENHKSGPQMALSVEGGGVVIVLNLPEPPSVNAAYSNAAGKGRVKTKAYKAWETECLWMIRQAKPGIIKGEYTVALFLSEATRKDVDNCLKPTLDLLSKVGISEDDSRCYGVVSVKSPDVDSGKCRIAINPRSENNFPFVCVAERAEQAWNEKDVT